jgi:hypothetical protein
MVVIIHGAIPIINQLVADRLIAYMPSNTIRMDENYWEEITSKSLDDMLITSEYISKQGFIALISCLNPQLNRNKKKSGCLEIQLLPNIHNLKKSLKKTKEVVEKNNRLQIDTSDMSFDDCLSKVREFVIKKLNINDV